MANQGNALSSKEIHKIIHLLSYSEMTIREIAERMGCSRSAVASINRRFGVRVYSGMRSIWKVRIQEDEYERQRS